MKWYERSQKSKCQTLLRSYLLSFCFFHDRHIHSHSLSLILTGLERGAFLRPDAVNNTNKCWPQTHTKVFKKPKQDGKGMSLHVIHLDTATRCKVFACIICPTHLLKVVAGLLDLPQASQKVHQHQAMMLCESKHVTVKVEKGKHILDTPCSFTKVRALLLLQWSQGLGPYDRVVIVGNITQIMANHTMVPESLTALLFQMPSAAFLAVKMTHLTKRYRERERELWTIALSVYVFVCKDKGTLWLAARLDNLGKAASFWSCFEMFNWTRDAPEKISILVHIVVLITNQYKSPNPAQRNTTNPLHFAFRPPEKAL